MDVQDAFSSSRLEIHLLGRFAVYIDEQVLPETVIKGRKARSLLKLIAHQRHRQMARDHATAVLWPDLDAASASSQLYKAIHFIRKALADYSDDAGDWIEITDDHVRIVPPGGLATDVQRFEQAARSGLKDKRILDLEMAVSVYTGEFLPMDRYAEWASVAREHYRQLYLDVLTLLADLFEKQGDLSDAAEMHRLSLEQEPTLESAHRGMMRVFARRGQLTRAFHQYDLCREVLREELGMSPSPETLKILDDIREGRFLEEKERESLRTRDATPISPMIGRSGECAVVARLLGRLATGAGGALVISGEAGIGKTRLTREISLRARRRDVPCFTGRSGTGTGTVAFGPFVELFEDVLRQRPELEEALPVEIGRFVPGFTGEGKPIPHADKLAARGYLYAQIHRFFSRLSRDEPVVVILEDLHAADRGSRELYSYLTRQGGNLPILFVATIRRETGEPLSTFLPDFKKHQAELIELPPLTYDEHTTLLHQHAADSEISPETNRQIFHLSEGNPLYALELMRYDSDQQQPDSTHNSNDFSAGLSIISPEKIPDTLRQLVDQKLNKLSPASHHLLYIAAVIGRRVPYEQLAAVWDGGTDSGEKELFHALEEVIRARLLEEDGLDYTFRHALVREMIYASISEARRRTLHSLTAQMLVGMSNEVDEEPVEQIAYHLLRAGEMFHGALYLMRAGERTEEVYAHDDALQLYNEAYNALESGSSEAQQLKCDILERIGDVCRACGRLEKSYDAYGEAVTLAEEIQLSNPLLLELYRKMAVVAIFRIEIDRAETYLKKAFELSGEDAKAESRLSITKALFFWHQNRLEEAYDIAQDALKRAKKVDAVAEASQACEILAMTCLPLGRWKEGLEYEMQRQIYGWSPEIVVATDAHLCLWEYHVSGDQPLQEARSFMEHVAEQATELGDLRCVAVCHYALGTMHLWRGQRRRAVKDLTSSLELHEQVGSPAGMAYALARKSVLHTLMGATELGWQAVQDGLAYAGQASVRDHCLQRLYGVGIWNRMESNDHTLASQLVDKSERLLEESGACAACALELYPWLAYFYFKTGQIERAQICGDAVSELAETTGNPIGKSIAAMIESSLCISRGKRERSEKLSRTSFDILEGAISEATHSPIIRYLNCMIEQQDDLRQIRPA